MREYGFKLGWGRLDGPGLVPCGYDGFIECSYKISFHNWPIIVVGDAAASGKNDQELFPTDAFVVLRVESTIYTHTK